MKKKSRKNPLQNGQKKLRQRSTKVLEAFTLPDETKKWVYGVVIFILAIIVALSFFGKAGVAGKAVMKGLTFLIGNAVFIVPLIFALGGIVFFATKYDNFVGPTVLAIFILLVGITGFMETLSPGQKSGGWLGIIFSWPLLKFFDALVSKLIFGGAVLVSSLIFWHLIEGPKKAKEKEKEEEKPSLIQKIFVPSFKVKELEPKVKESVKAEEPVLELKTRAISKSKTQSNYKIPPLDLLEVEKGKPSAGDTITNSAIIKKTLENFGLGVEMSEINIGPTVTQYSLKPAEGIKLSKITALNNNLSLALASHPIRIEAPIPGKPLVGIEVPNKERCKVRLRDLLADPKFQGASSSLSIVLGRDVSGNSFYADLARMPHLLVAGSTGTGKTIFLNSLITTLLYENSPETLRLILIDPKRVEFAAYKDIPHLLCPVIFDAQRSVNVLKWLVSEMERRFGVLSSNSSRDIASYNIKASKDGDDLLPYIVLIVDELADLMAARGRDIEAGIVRLAQMARAVGIHLVVATQRPSVEVITGLIKANITSRVTFQVASQVDSRTIIDTSGAEKLLGAGDLLFISAEVAKPRRLQGSFLSEKEVKRVVDFIKDQNLPLYQSCGVEVNLDEGPENGAARDLNKVLESGFESGEKDPLYEEAKRTVIESKKASASLLQRRLKIGYARAARLLDELEEGGVVGPGEGAKPREVFGIKQEGAELPAEEEESEDDGWEKV